MVADDGEFIALRSLWTARDLDELVYFLARGAAMHVQSPETSAAFGKFTIELVECGRGPIAITAGSTLNKIQASRVLAHERIRVFVDEPEALDWLMAAAAE